ncbi:hypothetical protein JLDANKMP_04181 [Stenotrophomonas sp. PE591]|nr:hypothetical protein [Stenotrophomonas sp. PE591]
MAARWQFPGGHAEAGETRAQTAHRETLEETGADVTSSTALPIEGKVHVFACQARTPLQVQGRAVNILAAPHVGREVIQARLVTRAEARQLRTRFPDQLERTFARMADVPESALQPVEHFGPATPFRHAEVERVKHTQQWSLGPVAKLGNVLGEFWFYLLAMPVLWLAFGARATRLMLMALMLVTVVVQGLKAWIAVPRPFSFDPALSLVGAGGPAMPSGHTASATAFFLLVALWLAGKYAAGMRHRQLGLIAMALLAGGLAGLSRVWLGVHYWSDVGVGLVLGVAVALAIYALGCRLSSTHSHDLDERACWAALAVVSLIAGLCWWTTALLLPLSVAIACVLAPRRGPEDVSLRSAAVLLAGLLLFAGFCLPIAQRAEPFVLEAGLQAMVYAAMGVWIAWGAGALAAAWTRRRMSGQAVPGWRYGEPPRASTHGVDLLECGRKRPRNWHAPPAQ